MFQIHIKNNNKEIRLDKAANCSRFKDFKKQVYCSQILLKSSQLISLSTPPFHYCIHISHLLTLGYLLIQKSFLLCFSFLPQIDSHLLIFLIQFQTNLTDPINYQFLYISDHLLIINLIDQPQFYSNCLSSHQLGLVYPLKVYSSTHLRRFLM